ncbi:unnamed protein product, partial [Amoebophrya sp. A25]|eukprot:GSA25T00017235001.1
MTSIPRNKRGRGSMARSPRNRAASAVTQPCDAMTKKGEDAGRELEDKDSIRSCDTESRSHEDSDVEPTATNTGKHVVSDVVGLTATTTG